MNATLSIIGAYLLELWEAGGVKAIVAQVLINTVVAVAAALKTSTLDLRKIGEFLYRKLLPYVVTYLIAYAAGGAAGVSWLAPVAYAAIFTTLAGDMLDNLIVLGLKLPDFVSKTFLASK